MSRKYLTPLQLPADPVNPLEAVTKQYVDGIVVVAAADPIAANPSAELWVDTTTPASTVPLPAGVPRGFLYRAAVNVAQTITTAASWQDLTNLYVVWTPEVGRRYRVSGKVPFQKLTAAGDVFLALWGGGAQLDGAAVSLAINSYGTATVEHIYVASSAASITHNLRLYTNTNGVVTAVSNQGYWAYLDIEDIGGT